MMMRGYRPALLLVFLFTAVLVPSTVALTHDYSVEPAFGTTGTAAGDLVAVTFWDLTIREMAIIGALAISPALVFPVEIFFVMKLITCLAFRRIFRNNILVSDKRHTIYSLIQSRPGISFRELSGETGFSRGALSYHLALMRASGKIVLLEDHGIVSYFENSGKYCDTEQKVIKYLHQETDRKILVSLACTPLLTRMDFEKILGLSGPTVSWHMKRLVADGVLDVKKDGRFSRYTLSEVTGTSLMKYCNDIPGLPALSADINSPVRFSAIACITEP